MLDALSQGFKKAVTSLQGKTVISEENINNITRDLQTSLLEADVEYGVAKNFLARVKEKSLGLKVNLSAGKGRAKMKVSAGDHFVKICKEELVALMGPVDVSLKLPSNRPASLMMVGLQGVGKTTTTVKIANYLREKKKRKPLLVAADVYRPAAIEQLKVLGERVDIPVFSLDSKDPVKICAKASDHAIKLGCDVVIFDTAGRLAIDETLMKELSQIKSKTSPDNILLVCDALMGQDAVVTAGSFDKALDLSGFVMTKLDGDARGGAALSIKEVTGKSIKFLGSGESIESLEEFRPEGLASRILGMGDVVGLMDDFERVADDDAEEDAKRILEGSFSFKDFYKQISMIQKMGSLKDIMAKLPMQIPDGAKVDDKQLFRIKSLIDSMTEKERLNPDLINQSRALRISKGSGRQVKDVNELLKKFRQMRQMMAKMKNRFGGMLGKIPGLNKLSGGGGMPSMEQMSAMMPGAGGGDATNKPLVNRNQMNRQRKLQRQNRKKNRKRR
jgi:signal recognition particle subunit SRP54